MKKIIHNILGRLIELLSGYKLKFSAEKVQARRVAPWKEVDGDKTLRLSYNLNKNSVVFDLGGYEGQWASDIYSMYRPRIYVFEPLPPYAKKIADRFKANPDIKVFPFGLSAADGTIPLSQQADASSSYKQDGPVFQGQLKGVAGFVKEHKVGAVDLMKINIEGGEYDLLDSLISTGLIKSVKNVQVQFHDFVPNADERMVSIQRKLRKTHRLTYQYPYVWENWELRDTR